MVRCRSPRLMWARAPADNGISRWRRTRVVPAEAATASVRDSGAYFRPYFPMTVA
jgi:hypothetical protein